jgi:hypothetical protein
MQIAFAQVKALKMVKTSRLDEFDKTTNAARHHRHPREHLFVTQRWPSSSTPSERPAAMGV